MDEGNFKLDLGYDPNRSESVSGWDYLTEDGVIKCVFSSNAEATDLDQKAPEEPTYWYAHQTTAERVELRRINENDLPDGEPTTIPVHKLVNEYTPHLGYYETTVLPAMQELAETLDRGDALRDEGRLYSAEMEYGSALKLEARNIRALFGLGLIYSTRREVDRTRNIMKEVVQMRSAFDGKNQHLFNEFGIALRKIGMYAESVQYYSRAIEMVKNDENLYYNQARAFYENGDWEGCIDALLHSHQINPKLEVTIDLCQIIVALADDESLLLKYDKSPVPPEVAAAARRMIEQQEHKVPLDEKPVFDSPKDGRAQQQRSHQLEDGEEVDIESLLGD